MSGLQRLFSHMKSAELWSNTARGFCLFLGAFCLTNLAGDIQSPGFDANLWWVDLYGLPYVPTISILLTFSALLLSHGLVPAQSGWRLRATQTVVWVLLLTTIANSVQYYALLYRGTISTSAPVPVSLFVAAGLVSVLRMTSRPHTGSRSTTSLPRSLALASCIGLLFPIMQMVLFGNTDYSRPADIAVVPGARAYADGSPSPALSDRVRTACELYRNGTVSKLLFSGGEGDGLVHETESMRRMARSLGVREGDILIDPEGLNTQMTVENSRAVFHTLKTTRVIVVSHFYHLPRLKMAYHRAGTEVWTVPARNPRFVGHPFNIGREVAAFWAYYLRPLRSGSA